MDEQIKERYIALLNSYLDKIESTFNNEELRHRLHIDKENCIHLKMENGIFVLGIDDCNVILRGLKFNIYPKSASDKEIHKYISVWFWHSAYRRAKSIYYKILNYQDNRDEWDTIGQLDRYVTDVADILLENTDEQ